jgi:hypothetical protein
MHIYKVIYFAYICPNQHVQHHVCVPISPLGMELKDEELLLWRQIAALYVRFEVVEPPEPAALASPLQPC